MGPVLSETNENPANFVSVQYLMNMNQNEHKYSIQESDSVNIEGPQHFKPTLNQNSQKRVYVNAKSIQRRGDQTNSE